MTSHRKERIAEAIREELGEILLFSLQDPRVPDVLTITGVKVTADLQLARVAFTQSPEDEKSIRQSLEMLESAAGFLRHQLAQNLQLRHTPHLEFVYDRGQRHAERVEELLRQAREAMPPAEADGDDERT